MPEERSLTGFYRSTQMRLPLACTLPRGGTRTRDLDVLRLATLLVVLSPVGRPFDLTAPRINYQVDTRYPRYRLHVCSPN